MMYRGSLGSGAASRAISDSDSDHIEGAAYSLGSNAQYVRVDHRGRYVAMTEKLLHCADVLATLQQMSGKGVAQSVAGRALGKGGGGHGFFHRPLYGRLVQVMTALHARLLIDPAARSRKHPLPGPFALCIRQLASERTGEDDPPEPLAEVSVVKLPDLQ